MPTQVLRSTYRALVKIDLPTSQKRQIRYHAFDLAKPSMPKGFEDYLKPVAALCKAAGATSGTAYLTVDEKVIKPGMSQRRPKPHVDGTFIAAPSPYGGAHWGGGGWLHYCNDVGATQVGRMAVIVASSLPGCRAWKGTFEGRPAPDGDLSHIASQLGNGEVLPADVGYLLSPDCVHESMVFDHEVERTFMRIALPVSYAEAYF